MTFKAQVVRRRSDTKNANPGTYVGGPLLNQAPDALVGETNGSVKLDGVDDHISIADSASLDTGDGPLTLEAWVRHSDNAAGWQDLFSKGPNAWSLTFGPGAGHFGLHKSYVAEVTGKDRSTLDTTNFHHYVATKNGRRPGSSSMASTSAGRSTRRSSRTPPFR